MAKHMIFGAGLIGCYLGAGIQSRGEKVEFIGRSSVASKLTNGILISDYLEHEVQHSQINFTSLESNDSSAKEIQYDYLWLTVKCTGIVKAVEQFKQFISPSTVILCCQNGLGSDAIIKQAFPENTVLRVMVPFNVVEIKPGHYHRGSEGNLTIELLSDNPLISSTLMKLSSGVLPICLSPSMSELLWAKLQLNLGNAVNALADIPVKEMLEDRHYRKVIALLMEELLHVVKEQSIDLPKVTAIPGRFIPKILSLPTPLFRLVAKKMLAIDPNVRTSMWWDISQGKKTEIDHLNGAVVKVAKRLGLETPYNERLVDLIKKVEAKEISKGLSGMALLSYVQNDSV